MKKIFIVLLIISTLVGCELYHHGKIEVYTLGEYRMICDSISSENTTNTIARDCVTKNGKKLDYYVLNDFDSYAFVSEEK